MKEIIRESSPAVYKYVCDGCGNGIKIKKHESVPIEISEIPNWGNDSFDFEKEYCFCSGQCCVKFLHQYSFTFDYSYKISFRSGSFNVENGIIMLLEGLGIA